MKRAFILLLCLLFVSIAQAQLVNIESRRIKSDSIRFVLSDGIGFSYSDNNGNDLLQLSNNLSCQLKSRDLRHIYLFLNKYKWVKTKSDEFINIFFAHLRYNYKLRAVTRLESFVQYQNNRVLDVDARVVYGAGLRFKVLNHENLWAYLGTTYMYEYEHSHKYNFNLWQHRSSNYVSMVGKFSDQNLQLSATMYFQPLYTDMRDYRILLDMELAYKIIKNIAFITGIDYFFDSEPPSGMQQYYLHTKFGCKISW